jgi:putative DNA primase/helicase
MGRPVIPIKNRPKVDTSAAEERAERAVRLCTPAPDNHPYLTKKRIQAHGIGLLGEGYPDLPGLVRKKGDVLVIPIANVRGKILSCQFIAGDGSKAYMAGSKQPGGFFYMEGKSRLWICEGFATGASLQEDTGDTVACAFDTGGLNPVTAALTALYGQSREIIILADDDWQTDGNPGITKAKVAAQAYGIKFTHPDFTGFDRGPKDTDYNDLRRLRNGL